jgi:hypothetical protein
MTDRPEGWPLLKDVLGTRVRLKREMTNGFATFPAGMEGEIVGHRSSWAKLIFEAVHCPSCKARLRMGGLMPSDLERIP